MVTFCLGSARRKREYFKEAAGAVVLDNVEVLFCASEDGYNCFALGDVPFSEFTVIDYLSYRRALQPNKVAPETIRAFGLVPHKKLKSLVPAEMRIVTFLELTAGATDKPIVVNLDGAKYTRRNARALRLLLSAVPESYVCVTDKRFTEGYKGKTLTFGKTPSCRVRPTFYAAKRLAKKLGAKKVLKT